MDMVMEDTQSNDHTPKVSSQQTNVEESRRRKTEDNRGERVEDEEDERVSDFVPDDLAIPSRLRERFAVKDRGLNAVDDGAPESELADHFVHGTLGDSEFFEDVVQTVECGTCQREQVTLELIAGRNVAAVAAGDVVGCEQEAHTGDTDEDTSNLSPVVSHLEEDERDCDNDDNGPEVDELCAQDSRVAVGENGEVIALDVEEREDNVLPAVLIDHARPAFETLLVQGDSGVDDHEEDVVEQRLEGRNRSARIGEQSGQGRCCCVADGEKLTIAFFISIPS